MAITSPRWVLNQPLHASSNVAAGAAVEDDINLSTLKKDLVLITVEVAFGPSPDDGAKFNVFYSSDGGTNNDTEPALSFTIEPGASLTKRRSFAVSRVPYVILQALNLDSADDVIYASWYAAEDWETV